MHMLKKNKNRIEDLWKIYGGFMTVLFIIFFLLYCVEHTKYDINGITQNVVDNQELLLEQEESERNRTLYKKLKRLSDKTKDFQVEEQKKNIIITIQSEKIFYNTQIQLKQSSFEFLNRILKVMKEERKYIDSIIVLSHTMQIDEEIPNEAVSDRILTATRSAKISAYIQQKNIVEPQNIFSIGCGQFSPLVKNGNESQRKKNERIEIKIQKKYRQE